MLCNVVASSLVPSLPIFLYLEEGKEYGKINPKQFCSAKIAKSRTQDIETSEIQAFPPVLISPYYDLYGMCVYAGMEIIGSTYFLC